MDDIDIKVISSIYAPALRNVDPVTLLISLL